MDGLLKSEHFRPLNALPIRSETFLSKNDAPSLPVFQAKSGAIRIILEMLYQFTYLRAIAC